MHKKHLWIHSFTLAKNIGIDKISEDMDLENKAITERGYEHTHKYGQWMHSKGEVGEGTVIVCNVERCQSILC